jgi:hypothetical protein
LYLQAASLFTTRVTKGNAKFCFNFEPSDYRLKTPEFSSNLEPRTSNNMTSIQAFLSKIESPRKELITKIHELIIKTDKTVGAEIGTMMRQEMIIYNCKGFFKYGLAGGKAHMSLHLLPIYGSPTLHAKYSKLLAKAKFQKGCVNFKSADEMPLPVVKKLMEDCAKIDMEKEREKWLKSKKAK